MKLGFYCKYIIKLDTVLLSNRICFLIDANLLCMLIFGTCWIIHFSWSPETTSLSYKWDLKLLVSKDYNKYELNQRGLWISPTLHTTRSREKWDEWSLLSGKTIILPFLTLFAASRFFLWYSIHLLDTKKEKAFFYLLLFYVYFYQFLDAKLLHSWFKIA